MKEDFSLELGVWFTNNFNETFKINRIILKKEIKDKKQKKFDESFKGFSIKQLNKKISKAIEEEDYELAAKLRDEINQRK